MFSWNQYNSLGLGLSQIYNSAVVYNRKRHGVFKLGGKTFDFRRPARGFPSRLSPEFLLVDLVNNLDELSEDSHLIKSQIKDNMQRFNWKKVLEHAEHYGKIATTRFFKDIHG